MYYNYPTLQLNQERLQKYDILDEKPTVFNCISNHCVSSSQVSSLGIQKPIFPVILLTQEWFYGQRPIMQGDLTLSKHNQKSVKLKITTRRFHFWNLLDLYLNSVLVSEELKNHSYVKSNRNKGLYILISFSDLTKNNLLLPKIKENFSFPFFQDTQLKILTKLFYDWQIPTQNYFIPTVVTKF
uniref:Uncharacterized protein n=1 Tax=Paralemanea sp. TaxID=2048601 RepID=A0A343UXZ5_9FLOR|nr:hypothetical protein [Paralemanea sp.]